MARSSSLEVIENEGPNYLQRRLLALMNEATAVDIAVAFVTTNGLSKVLSAMRKVSCKAKVAEVRRWAEEVIEKLRRHADLSSDRFTVLASVRYRRFLLPQLGSYEIPLEGLVRYKQISKLKNLVGK